MKPYYINDTKLPISLKKQAKERENCYWPTWWQDPLSSAQRTGFTALTVPTWTERVHCSESRGQMNPEALCSPIVPQPHSFQWLRASARVYSALPACLIPATPPGPWTSSWPHCTPPTPRVVSEQHWLLYWAPPWATSSLSHRAPRCSSRCPLLLHWQEASRF